MPHIVPFCYHSRVYCNKNNEFLKDICKRIDFNLIEPHEGGPEIIKQISETDVLLTESLHGAIIAESLRVPWIPIVSSKPLIEEFKWHDFCMSLKLKYKPQYIYGINNYDNKHGWMKDPQNIIKQNKKLIMHYIKRMKLKSTILPFKSKYAIVEEQFLHIAKNVKPTLSKTEIFDKVLEKLESKINEFKKEWNI